MSRHGKSRDVTPEHPARDQRHLLGNAFLHAETNASGASQKVWASLVPARVEQPPSLGTARFKHRDFTRGRDVLQDVSPPGRLAGPSHRRQLHTRAAPWSGFVRLHIARALAESLIGMLQRCHNARLR